VLYVEGTANASNSSTLNSTATFLNMTVGSYGNYTYYMNCTDGSNVNVTAAQWILFNQTIPNTPLTNISIGTPPDGVFVQDLLWKTINFTVVDSDTSTLNCVLYVNWTANVSNASTLNNTPTFLNMSVADYTNYTYYVNCSDGEYDNKTQTRWILFNQTLDSTPPVITIVYPQNNTNLSAGTAWTFVNISTDETAVCKYNFTNSFFGYPSNMGSYMSTSDNINHWLNYSGLSSGLSYDVYYKCNDTSGNFNTGQALHHEFGVNQTVPMAMTSVQINSPADGAMINNSKQVYVNFTVIDPDTSILNCTLYKNNSPHMSEITTNNTETELNFTVGMYGNYTIFMNCTDGTFFNVSASQWILFQNITTIPAPAITTLQNWTTNQTADIRIIFDKASNASIEYGPNSSMPGYDYNDTYKGNHIFNLTGLANNTVYYFNVTACDILSNCNETGPYNISTDQTDNPPVVTLEDPGDGYTDTALVSASVHFNCSATDDNGLVNVSLYITNPQNTSFAFYSDKTMAGTSDWRNWTLALPVGNYTWNCLVYDNNDQADWGDANRTLQIYPTPWFVTGNISAQENCTNANLLIDTDLNIYSGGQLVLDNCTLRMNGSANGDYRIFVEDGGTFIIRNGSNITKGAAAANYNIYVVNSSTFEMRDSRMSYCGYVLEENPL